MDVIDGRITSIWGRTGAVPRLQVQVSLLSRSERVFEIINLSSKLQIATPSSQMVHGLPVPSRELFVGEGHISDRFGRTLTKGVDTTVDLYFVLTPAVIQAIETHRKGKDIEIRLSINTVLVERDAQDRTPKCIHHMDVRTPAYDHVRSEVPRSKWLDTLKEMGYAEYYDMGIPLPRFSKTTVTNPLLPILQRAWEHFENGSDRETLATCWEAMEVLAKKHGATQPDQNAFMNMLGGTAHKEKTTKLANALRNWTDFLHLGRHEHDPSVELDHRDAEFALIMTHACFAYLSTHKLNKQDRKKVTSSANSD